MIPCPVMLRVPAQASSTGTEALCAAAAFPPPTLGATGSSRVVTQIRGVQGQPACGEYSGTKAHCCPLLAPQPGKDHGPCELAAGGTSPAGSHSCLAGQRIGDPDGLAQDEAVRRSARPGDPADCQDPMLSSPPASKLPYRWLRIWSESFPSQSLRPPEVERESTCGC